MKEAVLLIYGVFAGHALLLAVWLFLRHRNSGNRLLALILLLLTIRVGKSIISLAWLPWALPVNVAGLSCMAALGPFTLFYVEELFIISPKRLRWPHLIPAILCLGAWSWTMISIGYYVITSILLAYLAYTYYLASGKSEIYAVDNIRWKWTKGVMLGLGVLSISFVIQLIFYDPVVYLVNVGLSVAVLYILSLWALQQNKLFTEPARKNSEPDKETYAALGEKVRQLMDEEVFVDSDLNLGTMAKRLDVQPYLLSKAVNSHFKISFPELILEYRLRKAEQLLISSFGKVYTIEAIAYESGFNTLSVFYQAFRKRNGMPPAEFKRRMEGKDRPKMVLRAGGTGGG